MQPNKLRFRCPHCGNLILGPVEYAGRAVRCPHVGCGNEMIVPSPPPATPLPVTSSELTEPTFRRPQAFEQTPNPDQTPSDHTFSDAGAGRSETLKRVKAPGIALIIGGTLDTVYAILNWLSNLFPAEGLGPMPAEFRDNAIMRELWEEMNEAPNPVGDTAVFVVMAIAGAVIIFGGARMLRLANYRLAMAASILSMIPCISCLGCCGAGQAVGIWALVILSSADVRSSFQ